ncbi:MAG: hypothetical protein MUC68_07615 [Burkholderiaceae bacterium]|nr:hypothetical protein [Burkholderiaceae bacterium]
MRWLLDGVKLFRKQPLGLPAMVGAYLGMLLLPAVVPLVGVAIAGILSPFATVGLMQCFREAALGRAPTLAQFAQPFQDPRTRLQLFRLGMFNAGLLMLVALLSALLSPEPATSTPPQTLEDLPLDAMLLQMLLYSPVMALMWFAPLLTGWHGMTPGKAMFGSVVACWRNLGAMLIYGLASLALLLGVLMAAIAVLSVLVPSREILMVLAAPIVLVLMTIVQGSFFPMYLSVFTEMPPLSRLVPADEPAES